MNKSLEAKVDEKKVLGWIKTLGGAPSSTSPLLQAVQGEYGYLPRKALNIIVQNTEITGSQLYGVATFYSQFRLNPIGRNTIKICHGTACHVRGADRLNTAVRHSLSLGEEEETTKSGGYTLEDVACVGCCSLAPVMVIGADIHGNLAGTDASRALKKHAKEHDETL